MFAANILENPNLLIASGLFMLTLLVGAGILAWMDRWRRRQMSNASEETLTSYRELYEAGEISKAEYDAIRTKVARRVVGKTPPALKPLSPPPKDDLPIDPSSNES